MSKTINYSWTYNQVLKTVIEKKVIWFLSNEWTIDSVEKITKIKSRMRYFSNFRTISGYTYSNRYVF